MSNSDGRSKLERLIEEQERIDAQRMRKLREQDEAAEQPAAPMSPTRKRHLIIALCSLGALVLIGVAIWIWAAMGNDAPVEARPAPTPTPTSTPTPTPTAEPEPEPEWDVDDPASMQVIVNKQRPLDPIEWAPEDLVWPDIPNSSEQPLRAEAAEALEQMYAEAEAAGVPFAIVSGYRDYGYQGELFDGYAASDGVEAAETYSARAGHSEHQTGLAVDISECYGCELSVEFGDTPQGIWARENAHRFGFILRYNDGEQPVVGYVYEPWHFRYVGAEIAEDMKEKGVLNLEDYFDLPAAPAY